jgi:hypothetical protein
MRNQQGVPPATPERTFLRGSSIFLTLLSETQVKDSSAHLILNPSAVAGERLEARVLLISSPTSQPSQGRGWKQGFCSSHPQPLSRRREEAESKGSAHLIPNPSAVAGKRLKARVLLISSPPLSRRREEAENNGAARLILNPSAVAGKRLKATALLVSSSTPQPLQGRG